MQGAASNAWPGLAPSAVHSVCSQSSPMCITYWPRYRAHSECGIRYWQEVGAAYGTPLDPLCCVRCSPCWVQPTYHVQCKPWNQGSTCCWLHVGLDQPHMLHGAGMGPCVLALVCDPDLVCRPTQ